MAIESISFETLQCQANKKFIIVDKEAVKLLLGDVIEFKNGLTGKPDMILTFSEVGSSTPIPGFCTEMGSASEFLVPGAAGSADCTLAGGIDAFKYTAKTAPGTPPGQQHQELDPVIIITPSMSLSMQFLTSPVGIAAEVAVLVLIFLVYRLGVRKGLQKRTTPAA